MALWDPTGAVIVELRNNAPLGLLVGSRVRGGHPGPGDKQGAGAYRRFVVVSREGVSRPRGQAPIQTVTLALRAYGATPRDAAAVMGAASDALHKVGPRAGTGGGHIYLSQMVGDAAPDQDPRTFQPFEEGFVELICTK